MTSPPVGKNDLDAQFGASGNKRGNQVQGSKPPLRTFKDPSIRPPIKDEKSLTGKHETQKPQEPVFLEKSQLSPTKPNPAPTGPNKPSQLGSLENPPQANPSRENPFSVQVKKNIQETVAMRKPDVSSSKAASRDQSVPLKMEGPNAVYKLSSKQPKQQEPSLLPKSSSQPPQNLIFPIQRNEAGNNTRPKQDVEVKEDQNSALKLKSATEGAESFQHRENTEIPFKFNQKAGGGQKARPLFRIFSVGKAQVYWNKIKKHVQDLDLIRQ